MGEHSFSLGRFIDVLNKACESEFIHSTEDHRKELGRYKYILRRALVELKQLIKEINADANHHVRNSFLRSWLSLLEMELKYSFIHLAPFMMTRMDVPHDDFVSVVHDAEMSMRGESQDIHTNFNGNFVALEEEVLKSWDCIARVLLREFASAASNGEKKGEVIVCPSSCALMGISSKAAEEYVESNGIRLLKRWMDKKVFPLLSKKLLEYDGGNAAGNINVFIVTEEETGELSFFLESPCPSPNRCC